jgi:uncharacterized protein (DUF2267 family)
MSEERLVQRANAWVAEVASELETEDRNHAERVLRAVLHTLRDCLTVEEVAQLGAQLPTLTRGVYYEGWRPGRATPRYRQPAEFLDAVAAEAGLHGETEASFAVAAVTAVLRRHVSAGELEDVVRVLPNALGSLVSAD